MKARLPFPPARGFTLIEVIVTLTIFVLLTASVFGIMTAVFQSSNDLQANQNRRDQVSALRGFLKNNFDRLASADHFIPYSRDGEGLRLNGLIFVTSGVAEALDATPQANGFYLLRLGRPTDNISPASFRQQLEKNQSAVNWTPLIRDVRSIGWKFQAISSPDWVTDWTRDPVKPALVECSIQLAGDDLPTTLDFPVVRIVPPSVFPHARRRLLCALKFFFLPAARRSCSCFGASFCSACRSSAWWKSSRLPSPIPRISRSSPRRAPWP